MTDRTVLDVAREFYVSGWPQSLLRALGIDPDVPFEQFQRWLRWGQRVEATSEQPDDLFIGLSGLERRFGQGWNACLDHVKEES